ncbi:hypothetical protein ACQ4N7_30020 [Nodosilinea sp. AN01ver1]
MSPTETQLWRDAVKSAIVGCTGLPPLPAEWKATYTPPFTPSDTEAARAALRAHRQGS